MKTMSRTRTVRQLLFNQNSGVPLAANANSLNFFFGPSGYSDGVWTASKGDLVMLRSEKGIDYLTEGKVYWSDGDTVAPRIGTLGTWPTFTGTTDALFVVAGHHTLSSDPNEGPTLTFRMGSGNAPEKGSIRLRMYPASLGGFVGDGLWDDAGNSIQSDGGLIDMSRESEPAAGPFIMIGALDRANNLWNMVTWTTGKTALDEQAIDISTIGDITPITQDDGASTDNSDRTVSGEFYGIGCWSFDALKSDWKEAGLAMGLAWIAGYETFWPLW